MPYDVKRFIFSVSLCAMLAVNPVLATTPTNDEDLGTTHDVYVESTLNQATNGIAGVSYVNRMVNAAGNAAELAEGHAAAAGAHALSAAQSADEAHRTLSNKLDKSGWSTGVLFADGSGLVGAGKLDGKYIQSGSIPWDRMLGPMSWSMMSGQVSASIISGGLENAGLVMTVAATGFAEWGQVGTAGIAPGAVTIDKTDGVVGMVPVGSADATTYGQFWIE